jgi:hypothetical protein
LQTPLPPLPPPQVHAAALAAGGFIWQQFHSNGVFSLDLKDPRPTCAAKMRAACTRGSAQVLACWLAALPLPSHSPSPVPLVLSTIRASACTHPMLVVALCADHEACTLPAPNTQGQRAGAALSAASAVLLVPHFQGRCLGPCLSVPHCAPRCASPAATGQPVSDLRSLFPRPAPPLPAPSLPLLGLCPPPPSRPPCTLQHDAALMYEFTRKAFHAPFPLPYIAEDVAMFLLVRGPFAWLGKRVLVVCRTSMLVCVV